MLVGLTHGELFPAVYGCHNLAEQTDLASFQFDPDGYFSGEIQSVCLYLKINVLSEIMDHSGTQILPQALQHLKPMPSNLYKLNNQSMLLWPTQPCPRPTAWQARVERNS